MSTLHVDSAFELPCKVNWCPKGCNRVVYHRPNSPVGLGQTYVCTLKQTRIFFKKRPYVPRNSPVRFFKPSLNSKAC